MNSISSPGEEVAPASRDRAENTPGVLLLNFGGPRSLAEVPGFLYEILRDPDTLQLPFPQGLQNLLARAVTRRRGPEVSRQYGEIGGRSPIVPATERILAGLEEHLREEFARTDQGRAPSPGLPIWAVHRYLPGFAEAVVDQILQHGVDHLLAVPMYPHFSYTTTGSALLQVNGLLRSRGWEGRFDAMRSYPAAAGYLEAMTARLNECLESASPPPRDTVILCSAHGLPRAYVERGDPYVRELEKTLAALKQAFPQWRFELSFQSRVGPAEWLRPYTDEFIPHLAAEGVRHLVFLPISFVNDHIETLFEVGVTYFNLARAHGIEPYRVQAVEDHPAFIRTLAEGVLAWREEMAPVDGPSSRSGAIVPARDLLPPNQVWRRRGRWAALAWAIAACGTLALALI